MRKTIKMIGVLLIGLLGTGLLGGCASVQPHPYFNVITPKSATKANGYGRYKMIVARTDEPGSGEGSLTWEGILDSKTHQLLGYIGTQVPGWVIQLFHGVGKELVGGYWMNEAAKNLRPATFNDNAKTSINANGTGGTGGSSSATAGATAVASPTTNTVNVNSAKSGSSSNASNFNSSYNAQSTNQYSSQYTNQSQGQIQAQGQQQQIQQLSNKPGKHCP